MRMSIIEEFYQSLSLDGSDERRIANAKRDGIISSYMLTTKSIMNARRVRDMCLWCDEVLVNHICENAPDYNCRFTFGKEGEGVALVKVPKEALKPRKKKIDQNDAQVSIAEKMFDEMNVLNSCLSKKRAISSDEQKVFDESPTPNSQHSSNVLRQNQVHNFPAEGNTNPPTSVVEADQVFEEIPLPDFIREMAQSAKMEGNKAGEFDHEQYIGYHSIEDEQKTNAHNMFDELCEPENEFITAVTTIECENTLRPTPTKGITKHFFQFAATDNRLLKSDKMFGNLACGARLKNTSWYINYDSLCCYCVEADMFSHDDSDDNVSKGSVCFRLLDPSRLILLIDSNIYGLKICLLHADFDPKLIIFDPGGCWRSLVLQNMLDGRRKLKCLFTNMFRSMYNPKVSVVVTDVSIVLDCFLFITLEDKGVFKGKVDNVHKRSPCGLQFTIIIRSPFIPSGIKQMALSFNHTLDISSFHCQHSLWNDLSQNSWLPLVLSLSSWASKMKCDNSNNTSSFKRSEPYIMVLCKTSFICLTIMVQLSMYPYPPRVVATLDALIYFLPIVHLSFNNVVEILGLSLSYEEGADGERNGVYGIGYTKAATIWLKGCIRSMGFSIRYSDVLYHMRMTTKCYTRLEKNLTLYCICVLYYKFRGGMSIQVFNWIIGVKIIIVELLRRLNVSTDSLVAVFRDIEFETSCWRSIIICYARAMKCWVGNSRKLNVTANVLKIVEQSRCLIPLSDLVGKSIKRARKLALHRKLSIITSKRSDKKVVYDIHWIIQVSHFVFDPGGDGNDLGRIELHQAYECGTKHPKAKGCENLQIFVFDPGGGGTCLLARILLLDYVPQI